MRQERQPRKPKRGKICSKCGEPMKDHGIEPTINGSASIVRWVCPDDKA